MIIVKLIGGLGNQMFQYAAGRRLSHVLGHDLKLDISGFEKYSLRTYHLNVFNTEENFATADEIADLKGQRQRKVKCVLKFMKRRQRKSAPTYVKEKHFHFDPGVLNLQKGVYLEGYWQSEKYFIDIKTLIQREFTIKVPQTIKNRELSKIIDSCESISLHVRRGDLINNPHTRLFHGTCDLDYYSRSTDYISQIVKHPHFFIFSDSPEWVRNNLHLTYPAILIEHNTPNKCYEDLRLMSQCKHHIVANSSFSWWGAWLGKNKNKIVIAPEKWFNTQECDTKDLLPTGWVRL
ncbi:MAG: alpha-1,2-fucosyltransferase [bacterium]